MRGGRASDRLYRQSRAYLQWPRNPAWHTSSGPSSWPGGGSGRHSPAEPLPGIPVNLSQPPTVLPEGRVVQ